MLQSYRNQSVDLQSKSTDWFLYNGNIGRLTVICQQSYGLKLLYDTSFRRMTSKFTEH